VIAAPIERVLTPAALKAARRGLEAIAAGLVPTNQSVEVLRVLRAVRPANPTRLTWIGRQLSREWNTHDRAPISL